MAEDRRSDEAVQRDVLAELQWDARVVPHEIGVAVRQGMVTLAGWVDSYQKRWAAEQAVLRVRGARGVVNGLEVRLRRSAERTDPQIAEAVVSALESDVLLASQVIDVTVSRGWVTLKGEVEWNFVREDAERIVRNTSGVRGVTSRLAVRARPASLELANELERALARNADVEASRIRIDVADGKVTLRGTVRAWTEREEAARVAWQAPGVTEVDNQIVVAYA